MDELLEQFLIEGPELAQQAADDLLTLERFPDDDEGLNSAFRAIHTLKGSTGLFDIAPMGRLLQSAEDLMSAMRRREIARDRLTFSALLAAVSQCETWLTELAGQGRLGANAAGVAEALASNLTKTTPVGTAEPALTQSGVGDREDPWAERLAARHAQALTGPSVALRYRPDHQAYFNGDDPLALLRQAPELLALEATVTKSPRDLYDPFVCTLMFEALFQAPLSAVRSALRLLGDQVELADVFTAAPMAAAPSPKGQTLRIAVGRIDALADLVGELLVAKNALSALARRDAAFELLDATAVLERLTVALHGQVTALRLTSLAPVFRRLRPLVRQIAVDLGKGVDLIVEGEETEADKTVADAIYEPLLHLVRNAIDHGIETPAQRDAADKSPRATVKISARPTDGAVVITITDDGRGIDPEAIRRIAGERGLYTPQSLNALSDEEAVNLVFEPGFSTAKSVTALSGRGVGMDAVRAAVARIGGTVQLRSVPGLGTRVTLTAPLTRVMTKIMTVVCGQEQFGAPLEAITETLQLSQDRIFKIRHGQAFLLRGKPVPLLRLASLLAIDDALWAPLKVLVVSGAEGLVGVAVDGFGDRLDVMLRPLDGLLAGAPGFSGTTLLGDGQVLLILDLQALTR